MAEAESPVEWWGILTVTSTRARDGQVCGATQATLGASKLGEAGSGRYQSPSVCFSGRINENDSGGFPGPGGAAAG